MQRVVDYDVVQMQRDMAARGWDAADLADRAGVNKSTVSRFFSGQVQTAPTAKKLATALRRKLTDYIVAASGAAQPVAEARL